MALPTSGQITLQTIKTEFGPSIPNIPVNLSDYYRGGLYVRNTGVNVRIPTSGEIKFSDFYGGVKYVGSVSVLIVAETYSNYANSNNGYISVTVTGNSPSFTVTIGGNSSTLVSGQTFTRGGYDSSASVNVTVVDTAGTHSLGSFTIGYNAPNRTIPYTLPYPPA